MFQIFLLPSVVGSNVRFEEAKAFFFFFLLLPLLLFNQFHLKKKNKTKGAIFKVCIQCPLKESQSIPFAPVSLRLVP